MGRRHGGGCQRQESTEPRRNWRAGVDGIVQEHRKARIVRGIVQRALPRAGNARHHRVRDIAPGPSWRLGWPTTPSGRKYCRTDRRRPVLGRLVDLDIDDGDEQRFRSSIEHGPVPEVRGAWPRTLEPWLPMKERDASRSRSMSVRTVPSSSVSHTAPTKSAGTSGTAALVSGLVRSVTAGGACCSVNQLKA